MIHLHHGDAMHAYPQWPIPMTIISDGPYGIRGYPGDPAKPELLPAFYASHAAAWADYATSHTTLWFWNTEVGWALTHPVLVEHGWVYRGLNIWDKGIAHIAGNCNGNTMAKFPTVTEVCAHYVRDIKYEANGEEKNAQSLQTWFRNEWKRTGLPFSETNVACGVKNAASRKYFASDHVWYMPPPEMFDRLARYANEHGNPDNRPYFVLSQTNSLSEKTNWERKWAKFNFEYGVTNVWQSPANRGGERLKIGGKVVHANQKPLTLLNRIIAASTDEGDVVWEPFAGTASISIAAHRLKRVAYAAEINDEYYQVASKRIAEQSIDDLIGL